MDQKLEGRILEIEKRLSRIESTLGEIETIIRGRFDQNESRYYGGLTGFGGDSGRLDWLQSRVNFLIKVLDDKFGKLAERLSLEDLTYSKGIDDEVNRLQLRK